MLDLELTSKKDILFIIGDWNGKVGSQEIPGGTGNFVLGEQRLIEFCQENTLVIANTLFQQHKRWLYTWTLQTANTKIRLIIFFSSIKEFKYTVHIPWGRIRKLPWISTIFSWLFIPCLSTSALPPINICLNPCFKTQIVKKCGPQKGFHPQDPCRVLLSFMMRTRKYSFNSINSVVSLTRAVSLQQWKQTPPWIT